MVINFERHKCSLFAWKNKRFFYGQLFTLRREKRAKKCTKALFAICYSLHSNNYKLKKPPLEAFICFGGGYYFTHRML
jgi:hypothetical protein